MNRIQISWALLSPTPSLPAPSASLCLYFLTFSNCFVFIIAVTSHPHRSASYTLTPSFPFCPVSCLLLTEPLQPPSVHEPPPWLNVGLSLEQKCCKAILTVRFFLKTELLLHKIFCRRAQVELTALQSINLTASVCTGFMSECLQLV